MKPWLKGLEMSSTQQKTAMRGHLLKCCKGCHCCVESKCRTDNMTKEQGDGFQLKVGELLTSQAAQSWHGIPEEGGSSLLGETSEHAVSTIRTKR